jgi:hypothetical protein
MSIPYILFCVEIVTLTAACILGGIKYRVLSPAFKKILLLVSLDLCGELTGQYISRGGKYNFWFYNSFIIVEFWVIVAAGVTLLNSRLQRHTIILISAAVTCGWLLTALHTNISNHFYNWIFILSNLVVDVLYVSVLIQTGYSRRSPVFLLCVAFILYASCTAPLFGVYDYLLFHNYAIGTNLNIINLACNIIMYGLMLAAFLVYEGRAQNVSQAI